MLHGHFQEAYQTKFFFIPFLLLIFLLRTVLFDLQMNMRTDSPHIKESHTFSQISSVMLFYCRGFLMWDIVDICSIPAVRLDVSVSLSRHSIAPPLPSLRVSVDIYSSDISRHHPDIEVAGGAWSSPHLPPVLQSSPHWHWNSPPPPTAMEDIRLAARLETFLTAFHFINLKSDEFLCRLYVFPDPHLKASILNYFSFWGKTYSSIFIQPTKIFLKCYK